jgi:hypothetical protein
MKREATWVAFYLFYRTKSMFPTLGFVMTLRTGITGAVGLVRRSGRELSRFGDCTPVMIAITLHFPSNAGSTRAPRITLE